MEAKTRNEVIEHLRSYLKSYTDRGCTVEAATLNFVREFGGRLHWVIIALLESKDG